MFNAQATPAQSIIRRTLTITTTETWIITFGLALATTDRPPAHGTPQDSIDPPTDQISQSNQREQP